MPPLPQGANILINDAGEVRLGECGWCGSGGGLAGGPRGQERSLYLSLCLQLTLVSRPRSGQRWLDASLSLGHPTGEGCLAGSWGWYRGQQLFPAWISGNFHPGFLLCLYLVLLNVLSSLGLPFEFSIYLGLSVPPPPVPLSVCVDFYPDLSVFPYLSTFASLSLSLSLSLCLYLAPSLCLSLSIFMFLSASVSLYAPFSLSLSYPRPPQKSPLVLLCQPWLSEGLCPQDGSRGGGRGPEGGIQ